MKTEEGIVVNYNKEVNIMEFIITPKVALEVLQKEYYGHITDTHNYVMSFEKDPNEIAACERYMKRFRDEFKRLEMYEKSKSIQYFEFIHIDAEDTIEMAIGEDEKYESPEECAMYIIRVLNTK